MEFGHEELADIRTDLFGGVVKGRECLYTFVVVAHDYSDNLVGVDFQHRRADAIARLEDRYFGAVRRIEGEIYVMEAIECMAKFFVKLDDDFVGLLCDGGDVADTCPDNHCSVILNVADFDDGQVEFVAEESVAEFLCGF